VLSWRHASRKRSGPTCVTAQSRPVNLPRKAEDYGHS